jgi:hypothetical protein
MGGGKVEIVDPEDDDMVRSGEDGVVEMEAVAEAKSGTSTPRGKSDRQFMAKRQSGQGTQLYVKAVAGYSQNGFRWADAAANAATYGEVAICGPHGEIYRIYMGKGLDGHNPELHVGEEAFTEFVDWSFSAPQSLIGINGGHGQYPGKSLMEMVVLCKDVRASMMLDMITFTNVVYSRDIAEAFSGVFIGRVDMGAYTRMMYLRLLMTWRMRAMELFTVAEIEHKLADIECMPCKLSAPSSAVKDAAPLIIAIGSIKEYRFHPSTDAKYQPNVFIGSSGCMQLQMHFEMTDGNGVTHRLEMRLLSDYTVVGRVFELPNATTMVGRQEINRVNKAKAAMLNKLGARVREVGDEDGGKKKKAKV